MFRDFTKSLATFIFDTLETLVVALAMFAVAYLFLFQPHQVNGNSMLPSFEDKDMLITEKVSYYFREPRRGEVVIFKYPRAHEYDYIKRIIGLPGESITIDQGRVRIFNENYPNGYYLDEPYIGNSLTEGGPLLREGRTFDIPEDEYIVLGDNREMSSDSRDWGTVSKQELVGKAWLRYWPPQTLAFIEKAEYQ